MHQETPKTHLDHLKWFPSDRHDGVIASRPRLDIYKVVNIKLVNVSKYVHVSQKYITAVEIAFDRNSLHSKC